MRAITNVVAVTLVIALVQCGGGEHDRSAGTCLPGSVRRCAGPWSCKGDQTCASDGTAWSACQCAPAGPPIAYDAGLALEAGITSNLDASLAPDASLGADLAAVDAAADAPPIAYLLLDDMEGTVAANGPIRWLAPGTDVLPGAWGCWRSSGDPANTMVPDPFSYTALPAPRETMTGVTSAHAAHLTCHIADLYGYCEQGFWLAEAAFVPDGAPPEEVASSEGRRRLPVDLSAFRGLVFWAMSGTASRLKVVFENADTDARGGRCGQTDGSADQCGDSFSRQVSLGNVWKRYEVRFSELAQEGWGHAAPGGKFDASSVYLIGFQINGPQSSSAPPVDADLWVDDVYLE